MRPGQDVCKQSGGSAASAHRVDRSKPRLREGVRRSGFRLTLHRTFSTPAAHDERGIRRHIDRDGESDPRVDLLRGRLIGRSMLEPLQGGSGSNSRG